MDPGQQGVHPWLLLPYGVIFRQCIGLVRISPIDWPVAIGGLQLNAVVKMVCKEDQVKNVSALLNDIQRNIVLLRLWMVVIQIGLIMSCKFAQIIYDGLFRVLKESTSCWIQCCGHALYHLLNSCNFFLVVCYYVYIILQYNFVWHSLEVDNMVNEYMGKGQCVECLLTTFPMGSLCHVFNKYYNSDL